MSGVRRNYQQSQVTKLDLWIFEPQALLFGSCTSDFMLETFDSSLHLNPPNLSFRLLQKPSWYAGIPITMVVLATNLRFQPILNSQIEVSVIANNRVVFSAQSSTVIPSISAQTSVTFPFRFIPPTVTNFLKVSARINFTFDSQLASSTVQINMQIYPSINCQIFNAQLQQQIQQQQRLMSNQKRMNKNEEMERTDYIGFEIENLFPFPISEIYVISGSQENRKEITEKLLRSEKVFGFVKKATTMEIRWSLPFARDCALVCPIKTKSKGTQKKIVSIHFVEEDQEKININNESQNNQDHEAGNDLYNKDQGKIPKIVSILTPFKKTLRVINKTAARVSGSFWLKNGDGNQDADAQQLMVFGCPTISFELEANEIKALDVEFIVMKEGLIEFPNLMVQIDGNEEMNEIKVEAGIIAVGKS